MLRARRGGLSRASVPHDRCLDGQRPRPRTPSACTTTAGTSSRSRRDDEGGSVTRPVAEVLPEVAEQLGQLAGWLGTLALGVTLVVQKADQLVILRVDALAGYPGRQP
jgi:hypothetical protein